MKRINEKLLISFIGLSSIVSVATTTVSSVNLFKNNFDFDAHNYINETQLNNHTYDPTFKYKYVIETTEYIPQPWIRRVAESSIEIEDFLANALSFNVQNPVDYNSRLVNYRLNESLVNIDKRNEDDVWSKYNSKYFWFYYINTRIPFIYKNIDFLPNLETNNYLKYDDIPYSNLLYVKYISEFLQSPDFIDENTDKGFYDKPFLNQDQYNDVSNNERYDELKVIWEWMQNVAQNQQTYSFLANLKLIKKFRDENFYSELEFNNNIRDLLIKNKETVNDFLYGLVRPEINLSIKEKNWKFNAINKKKHYTDNQQYFDRFKDINYLKSILSYAKKYFDSTNKNFDPNLLVTNNIIQRLRDEHFLKFLDKVWGMQEWSVFLGIPPKKESVESQSSRSDIYNNDDFQRPIKFHNLKHNRDIALLSIDSINKLLDLHKNNQYLINIKEDFMNQVDDFKSQEVSMYDQFVDFLDKKYEYKYQIRNPNEHYERWHPLFRTNHNLYFIELFSILLELNWDDYFVYDQTNNRWMVRV